MNPSLKDLKWEQVGGGGGGGGGRVVMEEGRYGDVDPL